MNQRTAYTARAGTSLLGWRDHKFATNGLPYSACYGKLWGLDQGGFQSTSVSVSGRATKRTKNVRNLILSLS